MTDFTFMPFQRHMVLAPLSFIAMLLFAGCASDRSGYVVSHNGAKPSGRVPDPGKQSFYNADGSFSVTNAKKAYYVMMRAYAYPIPKVLESDQFWVCDFIQHDFAKLGMGGIFWINVKGQYGQTGAKAYTGKSKDDLYGYLGHEIFLLPGQMLPEHRHVGGSEGFGPKMEGWHVRYGSVQFFGEHQGAAKEKPISEIPAAERPWGYGQDWFKSKYVITRIAGEMYQQDNPEAWHFMRAGSDGAIVSEYAMYHNQVEFSKPGMEFKCSEPAAVSKPQSK